MKQLAFVAWGSAWNAAYSVVQHLAYLDVFLVALDFASLVASFAAYWPFLEPYFAELFVAECQLVSCAAYFVAY